jgi:hypothetical protein
MATSPGVNTSKAGAYAVLKIPTPSEAVSKLVAYAVLGASGAPATPVTAITGPFLWKSKVAIRDLYNGVKGTFISPINGWQSSDFPPYAQDALHGYSGPSEFEGDANLAADGGDRRWLEIQLPFTISASAAQRLAKIELLRRRQQGMGTFAFNLSMYQLTALDNVAFTFPLLSWAGKLLEINAHRLTVNKQGEAPLLGCELDFQETDPSVYAWSSAEERPLQGGGTTVLPTTDVLPPTSVTAISGPAVAATGADGISPRIVVSWVPPLDAFVLSGGHIEIRYQQVLTVSGGTVSVTNGSASVSGTGTAFIPEMEGGDISINGVTYGVMTVASLTALTLTSPYTGTTSGTQAYFVSYGDVWIGLPSVQPSVTQVYIDGVTERLQYIVEVRAVNGGGFPSIWVEAGPVTAIGAGAPLPLRPYADSYVLAPHGFGFGLAQVASQTGEGPTLAINGTLPVNVFSTVAAPAVDTYGVTSAHTGGALATGNGIAQVFGIDSSGKRTPGSNFMQYAVLATASQVTFGVTWATGTTGYELFVGPDDENLIGQGPQTGTPSTITFSSTTTAGYGPPDASAVKFCARAKRVWHGGIAGTGVVSSTSTTVVIAVPSAPTANLWAGRKLLLISHAGLPVTQSFSVLTITANDANSPCTLTTAEPGTLCSPGDVVMISTKASAATSTSITDAGWVSPFSTSGLDTVTGSEIGNFVRILYDPTGAAVQGDVVRITANTSTSHTVTPFQTTPGVGTLFIVEKPTWLTGDVVTTAMQNPVAPTLASSNHSVLASVSVSALQGYVALVELLVQDQYGNNSPETPDGFRMLYIQPQWNTVVGFVMNDGSTGTNKGPMLAASHDATVGRCRVVTKASDSGTALTFTIRQNGTPVFTSAPTIAAGTAPGTVSLFTALTVAPLPVATSDIFTIDITSGGSAWQFSAQLEGTGTTSSSGTSLFISSGGTGGVSSLTLASRTTSVSTTLTASDYMVVAVAPSITITLLPSPVTGRVFTVKNGNSLVGQLIIVNTSDGTLIDTATSLILGATASLQVQFDGAQWRIQ